ncbi:hypothetical protein VP1G_04041 [Cytospora mali]|uniref:Uncharacterized protein n=1 Tax=Cytospora mali TaxID=578113 RepID=A0A194UY91_CYTMA|nr:hypothetical protein VP1G_04041 [Valsa mali var. pyri (nom. inval.)]
MKSIDWLGLFFLLTGVGCFTAALTLAPEVNWQSPWVVVMLIYSTMCIFGFRGWELYTDTPMVPRAIWQNYSLLLGLSSLQVGIRLLPQAVTGLILSPMIGCWMHKIPNQVILVLAALCQIASSVLLIFLRENSNYFAYAFPSLVLSTLGMDWVRNVGAQFIIHILPLTDQIVGAAILQIVTRLGIPLGMGITTVIWSSTEHSYSSVFIGTLSFAAIALSVSPFARVGRLGIASTASLHSYSGHPGGLPALFRKPPAITLTGSGLKNLNHDGPAHIGGKRLSQLIQPRSSSLPGVRGWKRGSSKGASSSFHLSRVPGPRISATGEDVSNESTNNNRRLSQTPQRTSTAMAARVIWLVCEDCGSSKRIVKAVGDPNKYFYDASWVEDDAVTELKTAEPRSSVYQNGGEDDGAALNKRRLSLLKSPIQPDS